MKRAIALILAALLAGCEFPNALVCTIDGKPSTVLRGKYVSQYDESGQWSIDGKRYTPKPGELCGSERLPQ